MGFLAVVMAVVAWVTQIMQAQKLSLCRIHYYPTISMAIVEVHFQILERTISNFLLQIPYFLRVVQVAVKRQMIPYPLISCKITVVPNKLIPQPQTVRHLMRAIQRFAPTLLQ